MWKKIETFLFKSPEQIEAKRLEYEEELEPLKDEVWFNLSDEDQAKHKIRRADLKKMLALDRLSWHETEQSRIRWELAYNKLNFYTLEPQQRRYARIRNTILTLFVGIVLSTVINYNYTAPETTTTTTYTPPIDVVNSNWDGSVLCCKEYLRANLNDWESYESIEWTPVRETKNGYLTSSNKFRAKNEFGATVIQYCYFEYTSQGSVIVAKFY